MGDSARVAHKLRVLLSNFTFVNSTFDSIITVTDRRFIMNNNANNHPPPYSVLPGGPPPPGFIPEPTPIHNSSGYPNQPQGYPNQPQGYPNQPQGYPNQPILQQPSTTIQVTPVPASTMIVLDGCPSCHVGILETKFPPCAILLAIFFFPLGLICCFAMMQRRCNRCQQVFSG